MRPSRFALGWRGCIFSLFALAAASAPVLAQGSEDTVRVEVASPLLPSDHWAVRAAWRADALGLVADFLPAQRAASRYVIGKALEIAMHTAEDRHPELSTVAQGWYRRFLEEFPDFAPRAGEGGGKLQMLGSTASLGYLRHFGRALPGLAEFSPERTGALSAEDHAGAVAEVSTAVSFGPSLVAQAAPSFDPEGFEWQSFGVTAGVKSWAVSAGRLPVGYGWAHTSGVVLAGVYPLDGIQVETRRALDLPGWLGHLGPAAFHGFLSRLPGARHPGRPFFWGARGTIQPHPRLALSVQRAALFGGNYIDLPINGRNLLNMFIGRVAGGSFENQIVSAAVRYRAPTESVVPLLFTMEWGAEDAAGAWRDVPGVIVGVHAPAMPSLPAVATGIEYASFSGSCCGNPPWYRHHAFPGAWAATDVPLGHPLGGQGTELSFYSNADLIDARLRLDGRAFVRRRGAENLYVPGRDGQSLGVAGEVVGRVRSGTELTLSLMSEQGEGWTESLFQFGTRISFGR